MERIELNTLDGATLAVRLFRPDSQLCEPRAAVVIGPAMGVRQDYYRDFAAWLAEQGFLVATFDYRGVGDSRPARWQRSLRGFEADLYDWARDYDAVVAEVARLAGQAPLYLVGHSLGAQLPGMLTQRDRIAGMLSIAAGSGYWRDNAPRLKRIVLLFWYLIVPVATHLCGYFPGRRLRKIGDIPRGVMLQWRRWCLHPRYHVGAEGEALRRAFEQARFPVVAWSITDDELMTERGTRALVDLYAQAPRHVERISPADVAAPRIGHFGFFREQFRPTLWRRAVELFQRFPHTQNSLETT